MASHASVAELFLSRVEQTPNHLAFQFPTDTGWQRLSWKQTAERVSAIASGLASLGLGAEQRCAILSTTRIDWILADLGIMCAAGATTTIYPSNTADECAYIINDSTTTFVFAEDEGQVAKLRAKRAEMPGVKRVITFDNSGDGDWVIGLRELENLGRAFHEKNPQAFDATARAVRPEQLATLIYTSGTTGKPKGVELTHDCWLYEGEAIAAVGFLGIEDHQYLWLPLSHSFGKVLELAQLHIGFASSIDGRIPKLVENLAVVKPTFMGAAPRIFEKVYNKVVAGAKDAGGAKYAIFRWAVKVGRRVSALRQNRQEPTGFLALQYKLADKLVFSKLRARFGGRIRFFISGAAPLAREIAEFFHAANILILEGYGLTETSAASFVNSPTNFRFGTVGTPVKGTQVKLAEDGEIWLKGRGVMRGYHNLPEATAETLKDGWLLTGDIGTLDASGILTITDRKKDLIKTSGGKYVAPQHIEGQLKAACPIISQVVVHGDRRNFCSALVTLDEETVRPWALAKGLNGISYADLARNDELRQRVQEAIDAVNLRLSSYETVKSFALLPKDLTVEDGELTASLKVKRKAVETKYKSVLDGFYSDTVQSI